ncbi:MAG: hypothetical protein BGO70_00775 [Bacteroidetes bacterium 43-93]|nr:hypothetical protein [Bacteroidota bacterium]OJW96249.1 MAG: hypothetical protein BGO70_00775 [Bacteroidetes bacterium 43-93]
MKCLISTLFAILFATTTALAQKHTKVRPSYSDYELKEEPATYAASEMGITAGPYFANTNIDFAARIQYTARVADHVQIAPMLTYVHDNISKESILGPGLNINFPIGKSKSYFYPGVEFGYFLRQGVSYGAHIGYTASVSEHIGINIEPGLSFIRNNAFDNNALFSILCGIRVNL